MEFRRSGQRRRRVLMEDARNEKGDTSSAEKATSDLPGYTESALSQPTLTDLIPVHPIRVLMTVLTGAILLVGLLLLDDWVTASGPADSAFRLGVAGSLASWFASALLIWAAAGAVLTFLIRRHRIDDYRGTYYVWIWAALMLILASVSATAPWHRELNRALTIATEMNLGDHGWWLATAGNVALLMAIRIGLEIRQCRTALTLLVAATLGYLFVALVQLGVLWTTPNPLSNLICQFGVLTCHLTLAYAIWWNARHVQLDAHGVHAAKAVRRAEARAAREEKRYVRRAGQEDERQAKQVPNDDAPAEERSQRRKSEQEEQRPSTKRRRKQRQAKAAEEPEQVEEPETIEMEGHRKMTKAERRKLRKQKRGRMAA